MKNRGGFLLRKTEKNGNILHRCWIDFWGYDSGVQWMDQFKKYLISTDKNLDILTCESAFLEYVGRKQISNMDLVVPPQDMIQLRNAVFAIDPGGLGLSCFRIRTAGGRLNWVAANVEKTEEPDETVHMELRDIQSLKADGALAQIDEMTGLLNKQTITERARVLTQRYPKKTFYFCLMDIDYFKSVNDLFGHMTGDEVIIDVAHILRDIVGENGVVGRIGGDEFMMVLENISDRQRVREVLAKIRETVESKYKGFRGSLDITVSIGTALFPDNAVDYDELFLLTDKMLYRAKMKGRNRYIIYTPEVHGDVLHAQEESAPMAQRAANASEKVHMLMDYMDRFLRQTILPIHTAMEQVLAAFDLDEIYVFFDELKKSRYGITRTVIDKDNSRIDDATMAMEFLAGEKFQKQFDENNRVQINFHNFQKDTNEKDEDLIRFMDQKYRFMVVYHMKAAKKDGYIVFLNRVGSACRLSESDVDALTYFGRMVELTSVER